MKYFSDDIKGALSHELWPGLGAAQRDVVLLLCRPRGGIIRADLWPGLDITFTKTKDHPRFGLRGSILLPPCMRLLIKHLSRLYPDNPNSSTSTHSRVLRIKKKSSYDLLLSFFAVCLCLLPRHLANKPILVSQHTTKLERR